MYDLTKLQELCIYVIEDDIYALESITEFISYYCKNVKAYSNSAQALEDSLKNDPDIIITDIKMPLLSGIDLAKQLKNSNSKAKIIFVSAYREPELFIEAIEVKAEHFLLKPFGKDELFKALEDLSNDIALQKSADSSKESFFIDETTNLPNRNRLVLDIKATKKPTLIIFEIQDFEEVGGIYGDNIADKLLKQLAAHYSIQVPQSRPLYKFEYNRFAILLSSFNTKKVKELIKLFETLSLLTSFETFGIEIYFKFRYGVAIEESKLIEKAYRALEHVKNTPALHYFIYRVDADFAKIQQKHILDGMRLRQAMEDENLFAFYQPLLNIKQNRVDKYETLARIKFNNQIIPPNDFIPVGKHLGLHTAITKNMITKSFQKIAGTPYSLSLNLSLEDFISNEVIDFIKQRVKDFYLDVKKIVIEVTEDISLDIHCNIIEKLEDLKKTGFKISIDDFGTQMSNLSNIALIEPDFIKIDGKFIKDLDSNPKNRAIVKGIVSIAQNLGAQTVAEFVHNEEILQEVINLDIDYAQGYHVGIPSQFIEGE